MEKYGVSAPRTIRVDNLTPDDVASAFGKLDSKKIVVKPLIGASGISTYLITEDEVAKTENLNGTSVLIQSFVPSIVSDGEYSFLCFNGKFSHCVLKTAADGEFRIQSRYGGGVGTYDPTPKEIEFAESILKKLPYETAYARVDVARDGENFLLMELELIEPELFFRTVGGAEKKFVQAVLSRI